MAKSVSKVILVGHVGKDPEEKTLPGGHQVANFSLATTERYKDKSGQYHDVTEWHNIVAYGKLAEIVSDYVRKGSLLYVEGKNHTRSWDDKESGKKVYRTEVVIRELNLLDRRSEKNGNGNGLNGNQGDAHQYAATGGESYGDVGITDDDIPF